MKEYKKCNGGGSWFCGCMAALYYLVGFVFYIIFFFNRFGSGDWLTTFFLIYGLTGFVLTFSILTFISIKAGSKTRYIYEYHNEGCGCGCGCGYHEEDDDEDYLDTNKKGNENE